MAAGDDGVVGYICFPGRARAVGMCTSVYMSYI